MENMLIRACTHHDIDAVLQLDSQWEQEQIAHDFTPISRAAFLASWNASPPTSWWQKVTRVLWDWSASMQWTWLCMVVEHFHEGAAPAIYRRVREKGRMLPDGLEYISSWVDLEFTICYQLMRTDDPSLFAMWTTVNHY